jgi:hypothetical protein
MGPMLRGCILAALVCGSTSLPSSSDEDIRDTASDYNTQISILEVEGDSFDDDDEDSWAQSKTNSMEGGMKDGARVLTAAPSTFFSTSGPSSAPTHAGKTNTPSKAPTEDNDEGQYIPVEEKLHNGSHISSTTPATAPTTIHEHTVLEDVVVDDDDDGHTMMMQNSSHNADQNATDDADFDDIDDNVADADDDDDFRHRDDDFKYHDDDFVDAVTNHSASSLSLSFSSSSLSGNSSSLALLPGNLSSVALFSQHANEGHSADDDDDDDDGSMTTAPTPYNPVISEPADTQIPTLLPTALPSEPRCAGTDHGCELSTTRCVSLLVVTQDTETFEDASLIVCECLDGLEADPNNATRCFAPGHQIVSPTPVPSKSPTSLAPTHLPTWTPCEDGTHGCNPRSTVCAAVIAGAVHIATCKCKEGYVMEEGSLTECALPTDPPTQRSVKDGFLTPVPTPSLAEENMCDTKSTTFVKPFCASTDRQLALWQYPGSNFSFCEGTTMQTNVSSLGECERFCSIKLGGPPACRVVKYLEAEETCYWAPTCEQPKSLVFEMDDITEEEKDAIRAPVYEMQCSFKRNLYDTCIWAEHHFSDSYDNHNPAGESWEKYDREVSHAGWHELRELILSVARAAQAAYDSKYTPITTLDPVINDLDEQADNHDQRRLGGAGVGTGAHASAGDGAGSDVSAGTIDHIMAGTIDHIMAGIQASVGSSSSYGAAEGSGSSYGAAEGSGSGAGAAGGSGSVGAGAAEGSSSGAGAAGGSSSGAGAAGGSSSGAGAAGGSGSVSSRIHGYLFGIQEEADFEGTAGHGFLHEAAQYSNNLDADADGYLTMQEDSFHLGIDQLGSNSTKNERDAFGAADSGKCEIYVLMLDTIVFT